MDDSSVGGRVLAHLYKGLVGEGADWADQDAGGFAWWPFRQAQRITATPHHGGAAYGASIRIATEVRRDIGCRPATVTVSRRADNVTMLWNIVEFMEDELAVERDGASGEDLGLDKHDEEEEGDGTALVDISWQQIHYGGPASSINAGIQLTLVRPGSARSAPYGDIYLGLEAESVELDCGSPGAYAREVAWWIKSLAAVVKDAVDGLVSEVDWDEETLEEMEDNTSLTVYISAECPQQELRAELADFAVEGIDVVWLAEQAPS